MRGIALCGNSKVYDSTIMCHCLSSSFVVHNGKGCILDKGVN